MNWSRIAALQLGVAWAIAFSSPVVALSKVMQPKVMQPTATLAQTSTPGSRLSVEQRYQTAKQQAESGQYDAAIATYQATLTEARSAAPDFVPFLLGNLAIAYRVTGQYQLAIAKNQEVIALFRQQGNTALEGRALSNLGNVYEALGNYDQAQQAFEQAQSLAQQTGDRAGQTVLWNSLGVLAAKQGKSNEAIAAYQRSLALATESGNGAAQASSWLNLGDAFHAKGKLNQALDYYQDSLAAAQSLDNATLEAEALGSLGVAYTSRRDFAKAVEHLEQSLALFEAKGDRARLSLTLNNLGHAHYNARQYSQAEAQLRRALTVLDDLRQGLSDLDKVSIFDTQTKTYNLLQQVLSTQSRSADSLEVAEWGRARAFADLLNQRLEDKGDALTTVEPPRIAELQRIARDRQATLVEYTLVPEDDFLHQGKQMGIPEAIYIWVVQPDGKVHQRRADLKPLIAQQQPLELLVRASRCFESARICKRQLQRQMRERAAEGSRGFSFNPPEPAEVVEASSPNRQSYAGLQQLHQLLIEPIAELLPDDPEQQVIVIPQGELFLVPFPALQDESGEFLIARHTLLTAPSIQTLALTERAKARLPKHQKTAQDFLVVGNPTMPTVALRPDLPATPLAPLPGSEAEAIAIASALNAQPLIGPQAKESVVLKRLSQARWVHFATHGLLSYGVGPAGQKIGRRPVPGAIALATDAAGTASDGLGADNIRLDGLLTSSEIINLRLNAELVVLSACDTGRGDLTGDGVVGLARAWMGAGVPSVVVSLWAVSDESTAALMQTFYDNLGQGLTKAQALRQAMLTTSQTYPNPSDWSAFTLLGEAE